MTATTRRDRCVTLGCDTPIDPDLWPMVCRTCRPDVDAALDEFWTEHDPEMAEFHHEIQAEDQGFGSGS